MIRKKNPRVAPDFLRGGFQSLYVTCKESWSNHDALFLAIFSSKSAQVVFLCALSFKRQVFPFFEKSLMLGSKAQSPFRHIHFDQSILPRVKQLCAEFFL